MTRNGSEWERQQARQRREAERKERESARRAKEQEKARKLRHQETQLSIAERRTKEVADQIERLDRLLVSILDLPPLTFDRLKSTVPDRTFNPGELGVARPAPVWTAPPAPSGLARVFGGQARHERLLAKVRRDFDAAHALHVDSERKRIAELGRMRRQFEREVEADRQRVDTENTRLARIRLEVRNGRPEGVEWFAGEVLKRSPYPADFPRSIQVAYRPETRDVLVELELPPQRVIPTVRGYKYIRVRDATDPVPRPLTEIKQRFNKLIACVALRTFHEMFRALPPEVVDAVVFSGRLTTTDRATGHQVRVHLLNASCERVTFDKLNLAEVDPVECLKKLNALVSPNPYDVEAIEPFLTIDLSRFRFSEDMDVVSGLDSRRNLLTLSPTEFEQLIRQLFVAMGAEAWTTIPSKDGGIDAVATSKDMFFGGVCLIQAKRWSGLVGLEAVHALTGVMADHNATTGVLVTTSWFSRTSEQFAHRHRIKLINGAELKHLIKEHLNQDVIPGTTPPRRPRASDNQHRGRPGPAI
uniref:restriction endonuclease n=1 Tax=Herbidospora sakaeratensis TaxID=564415 RepID=UPI001C3F3D24|nr:restriction endonuclease [Herbidospora sakaeratensis]